MVWPSDDQNTQNQVVEEVRQLIAQYRVQSNETERTVHGLRYFLLRNVFSLSFTATISRRKRLQTRRLH